MTYKIYSILHRFIPAIKLSEHADLVVCEGYIGFFILGYYLKKYHTEISSKKALLLGLVGLLLTCLFAVIEYVVSVNKGAIFKGYFYRTYLTPFVVMAVVGLFLYIQNRKNTQKVVVLKLFKTGSNLSIGVFYVHMLVLTLLENLGFTGEANVIILIAKTLSVYLVSLIISYMLSKIPFVKKILLGL